jgi:hypothetical protein
VREGGVDGHGDLLGWHGTCRLKIALRGTGCLQRLVLSLVL